MNTVLVVTADEAVRARVLRSLGGFTVFQTQSDSDALTTLRLVDVDVILRDSAGPPGALATFVAGVRANAPTALIVALGLAGADETTADFAIPDGFTARDLDAILRQALDKQRLLRELAVLRAAAAAGPSGVGAVAVAPAAPRWDDAALARVLQGFARVFAAGFDLPRVVEMALDAIGDLVRPTRMALLLPDPEGTHLRIVADRGLAPQIVRSVRLSATEGLARWLGTQGRPASLAELTDPELTRELRLLQGIVAVPLLAHGQLVAILVLGQPVVGGTYSRSELETLFDLATQLATGIRDVTLHHQLATEKEFTERILSHMSNGVVSIGRDHRIGIINRRAEEILGLPAQAALGQDLRTLPSPLGDLLFDTLSSGRVMPRTELQLALNRLWLEVSTYVVRGDEPLPLGAVIVFEDLTAQKELQEKKREAEQVQLLTRVVARIADEIKNPLVSINTFVELIGERYDDPEFRRHFSAIVRRDVRRLVDILEKLAGLVMEGELNFSVVDAQQVVAQLVESADLDDDEADKHVELELAPVAEPHFVKVDPAQLGKALNYLVRYLAWSSSEARTKISLSVGRHDDGGSSVRIMVASRSARVPPERAQRLFDPVHMVQESLVDVGPAVSRRLVEALGG
ncbi:MAG: GAF domain-containing protein, partial [Candidatus Rokuibacteriota bacterium]